LKTEDLEACDVLSIDDGLLGMSSLAVAAQAGSVPIGPAAGTIATPMEAFDSQLSLIEGEMMSAVKAIPADKFDFAPSQAIL
jgi:hypothetical protein